MNTKLKFSFSSIALGRAGLALLAATVLGSPARAQFTGNNQTNIISGMTSNWPGDYIVGNTNFCDALFIRNGGALSNGAGCVGYEISGSNNLAVVTGPGSVWSNTFDLSVGRSGAGNGLTITNGGAVLN